MKEDGPNPDRFTILVCIDGSDESYRGLRYAVKLGGGISADLVLIYVRPADQGLRSGGLQVRVVRENMLKWGLELPGITYLKRGLDILREYDQIGDEWSEEVVHTDVVGDPLGDNKIEYTNNNNCKIVLTLKVASDVGTGILQQWEIGDYNLIILGAPKNKRGLARQLLDPSVAEKVAMNAPCSVLLARSLEIGHGHLACTDGSERALAMVGKDALLAKRCKCKVSLLSVARDVESEALAKGYVDEARMVVEEQGAEVDEVHTVVGEPVDEIIEIGANHSIIVMSDASHSEIGQVFVGSVTKQVLRKAHNSVLIIR